MNMLIENELRYINQEYVVGIAILVILFIISPIMIVLVRNAVSALQVFSENVKMKARVLQFNSIAKSINSNAFLRISDQIGELYRRPGSCGGRRSGRRCSSTRCCPRRWPTICARTGADLSAMLAEALTKKNPKEY